MPAILDWIGLDLDLQKWAHVKLCPGNRWRSAPHPSYRLVPRAPHVCSSPQFLIWPRPCIERFYSFCKLVRHVRISVSPCSKKTYFTVFFTDF